MTHVQKERLLALASRFTWLIHQDWRVQAIHVEHTRREGSEATWAIKKDNGAVWSRDGHWEHEPLPSSRDEAFYARCRWTLAEACAEAERIADQERVAFARWCRPGASL